VRARAVRVVFLVLLVLWRRAGLVCLLKLVQERPENGERINFE
jgi:hypothetical protein